MIVHSRFLVWRACGALMALLLSGAVHGQAWPTRAVTIVSPFPAGGITDILSRIVAEEFGTSLGQAVVVENRTGAGGAIAMTHVAKSAADGYTLVMGGSAPTVIIPAVNPKAGYTPKDFEPIGYVAGLPIVMVVHPSLPPADLGSFIEYVRARPGAVNCAHHGDGTGTHLACLQFDALAGTRMTTVPYRGAPQVNQDLLANRVQVYFGTLPTELAFIRAGQLKAYGVASKTRAAAAREIPTLGEQGMDGLVLDSWNALYSPAGTPAAVVERLSRELERILAKPEVQQRIQATGATTRAGTATDLRDLTTREYEAYRKLAADAHIKLD